ncbi:YchJ family metal-binding protein [Pseudoalteromonas sp. T1lg65]|uniref:YchJ family metal-binding protein n=1 Tax=Pseudoalteromonas sp. T1lg65 TaxID=2077101 RepID=UPI003F7A459C
MRSRYSAYCLKNAAYIAQTYAHKQQSENSEADIKSFADFATFINLEILDHSDDASTGIVEFKAHYIAEGQHHVLHERSNFIKENNLWRYVNGSLFETPVMKLSRNDMCPCNSGSKYKKCHGK